MFARNVLSSCAAILVYCSVRDWTRFLRHRIRKYPDSPVHTLSDSLRIYFSSTLESGFIFSGYAVEFGGYVRTVAVSGKKKLRIRKYTDTCGWGLIMHKHSHCFAQPFVWRRSRSRSRSRCRLVLLKVPNIKAMEHVYP